MKSIQHIICLCIGLCLSFSSLAQNKQLDSLFQLENKTKKSSPELLNLYNVIGTIAWQNSSLDVAKKYALKGVALGKKIKDKQGLANAYTNLGISYWYNGNLDTALMQFNQALSLNKQTKNNEGIGRAYNNIGMIHGSKGEYPAALDYFFKGLEFNVKSGLKKNIANSYNNIGLIYKSTGQKKKAVDYYRKSLNIFINEKMKRDQLAILTNMANLKAEMKELDSAYYFYNTALAYAKELDHVRYQGHLYLNLAITSYDLKNFKQTQEYIDLCKDIVLNSEDEQDIIYFYHLCAKLDFALKKFASSKTYALETYKHAKASDQGKLVKDAAELLDTLNFLSGNYKEAYMYGREARRIGAEIVNEDNIRQLAQREMQFEHDQQLIKDSVMRAEEKKRIQLKIAKDKAENEAQLKSQRLITISSLLGIAFVAVILFLVYRNLKKQKQLNTIIQEQKNEVELSRLQLEVKNKEITDSITYAKRIQSAILPSATSIKKHLPESFVFYLPKDIVAGDFYWMNTVTKSNGEEIILFAAADCTGHGVPGAMVSVVCNNALNRAIKEFNLLDTGKILDKTRDLVVEEFEKSDEEVKDGMDISLCAYSKSTGKIWWSGANNNLWIIRNGEQASIEEWKADKQPIGKFLAAKPFTTHEISINKGDEMIMFTDGYEDQFGGEKGKKFKAAKMKELFLAIQDKTMEEQKQIINQTFEDWKGELEQVDDVCVIGIKF